MIFRKNIAIFLGLFLLGGLLAQAPIVAETGFTGFYKGRRFVEARASKSDAHSGLLNNRVAGLYDPDLPWWHVYVAYGPNSDQTVLNGLNEGIVYRAVFSKRPKLQSTGKNLLFELALTSQIGITGSLRNERMMVENFRPLHVFGEDALLYAFILSNVDLFRSSTAAEKYESLFTRTKNLAEVNTANFGFSYHFLEKNALDPYLRAFLGIGKENQASSDVARAGLAAGVRYFVNSNYYLVVEAEFTNYYFRVSPLDPETRSDNKTNLSEWNGHIGIGFAW